MWCIQGCKELRGLLAVGTNLLGDVETYYYSHKSATNDYLNSQKWEYSFNPQGEIISVEEFKFRYLDEFIVDCSNTTKEEIQEVYKFLVEYRNYIGSYINSDISYFFSTIVCNKNGGDSLYNDMAFAKNKFPNHKVYTFEEFKQKNKNSMEKKIIGYKLTKPEYRDAVAKIIESQNDFNNEIFDTLILNTSLNSYSIDLLKKAGVLDIWFEPVYKQQYKVGDFVKVITTEHGAVGAEKGYGIITDERGTNGLVSKYPNGIKVKINDEVWTIGENYETIKLEKVSKEEFEKNTTKTISVGGKFDVVIKNKEIWYKSDNITTFVKSLCDSLKGTHSAANYTYDVKEVVFSRTGCQNVETKLSDWLKVLKEIE